MGQVGDRINEWIGARDKLKAEDKAARAIFDALTPPDGADGAKAAHPLGNKDDFLHLSAKDRVDRTAGYVQAQSVKQAMEKFQADLAEQAANTNRTKLLAQSLALQNRGTAALPQFATDQATGDIAGAVGNSQGNALMAALQNRGSAPVMPGSGGVTPRFAITPEMLRPNGNEVANAAAMPEAERMRFAMQRNPQAAISPQFDNLLNALQLKQQQKTDEGFFSNTGPQKTEIMPGVFRAVLGRNQSQLVDTRSPKVQTLDDGQGGTVPVLVTGRGQATQIKTGKVQDEDRYTRISKQLNSLIAAQGRAFSETSKASYQTRIDELDKELQGLESEAPAGKAGASAATPSDTDIAYLKANPKLKAKFELRFGPGSAAKHLK